MNPRYPFGVHTISSRARYDHFDTAPWLWRSCRLAYDTICVRFCQVLFLHFFGTFIYAARISNLVHNAYLDVTRKNSITDSLTERFDFQSGRQKQNHGLKLTPKVRKNPWNSKNSTDFWSECRDSNSRPLEPHSSAIPNFATPGSRRSSDWNIIAYEKEKINP